ncbi:hypothetical protein [Fulvimarina sp. MAC8]|uniref:hypothetical protein n=1 Tax=Fulvimarina sp. MAC8 TaxID=3162874 RepID=UPI0032EE44A9
MQDEADSRQRLPLPDPLDGAGFSTLDSLTPTFHFGKNRCRRSTYSHRVFRENKEWIVAASMLELIEEIWQYIRYASGNILDQGWSALAGFLLGVSVSFINKMLTGSSRRIRHFVTRKKIDYLENKSGGFKVLEYGPSILVGHDSIKSVSEIFTLPFPEDGAKTLADDPDFTGSMATIPNIFGSDNIEHLGEILEIEGVSTKIEPHIRDVSQQFLKKERGISFNSDLYGVRTFNRLRHGPNEQPRLSLTCYQTDYFTFKVMDSFHREIVKQEHSKSLRSFSKDSDISGRLYPFLTSIGLNFVIISSDRKIILTERSGNIDRFGLPGKPIYPSFNEALASQDLPHQSGLQRIPSIPLCYRRGLGEELGLSEFEVDPPTYRLIGFGDVGIGFGVYGYANANLTASEITSRLAGQDREFESSRIFAEPVSRRSFNRIIMNDYTGLQVIALLRAMKVDFGI